jgi:hypothetical protein
MTFRDVDLIAYGDRGQPLLLVEVKGQRATTDSWAAQFRRNLIADEFLPPAPFFMIATPERMYFWRQDDPDKMDEPPQFTIDTAAELKPYFDRFKQSPETASRSVLESVLFTWLLDLTQTDRSQFKQDPSLTWLSDSGLLDAMSSARIEVSAVQ